MVRLLSLFSGIGAFEKALTNLGIPFDLVAYCEFDKYASKAYSVIHNVPESMNLGDITKIDEKVLPQNIDLVTYGFPCQPFSQAGKQEGFEDSKGRGNLFFDALRVIQHCKPKIAIAENVKNLTSPRFKNEFQTVLQCLNNAGYNNYWKVLDAKDYDIAQHSTISRKRLSIFQNSLFSGDWLIITIFLIKHPQGCFFHTLLQKSEVKQSISKQDVTCKNHI